MSALLAAGDVVSHLTDYVLVGPGGHLLDVTWEIPYLSGLIGPFSFSAHHVLLFLAMALLVAMFWRAARQIRAQPKRTGLTALLEVGLIFVRDDIVYPWLGEEKGRRYVPFFWTLFFFILACNLFGLLPWPLNLWHRTATGNIAVTAALAFIAFATIQVSGMLKHGWGGYWLHLVPHGVHWALWPIVWLIEFIGLFTKPFALTVRLFANMTAGHAIMAVLFGFLLGIAHYENLAIGGVSSVATFGFMLFIMLFETLVALIQAYIFTVLTAIFTSLAVAEEH